jgi:hypothetical protein
MTGKIVVLIGLLIACNSIVHAQTNNYEVRYGNRPIGNITATCKTTGSQKSIAIQSNVDMKLFGKVNLDITAEFDNNVLTHSKVLRKTGKPNDDKTVTTQKEGKNYTVIQNGDKSMLNNTEILHSVSELYFIEPKQITKIFSETQGVFLVLTSLGNGEYELALPDGKKNVYKYEKGVLTQVEINQAFGKAYIVRI